ncbi:MAG: DUF1573 domain-containing protein [Bacteroidota bacterium]
MKLASLLTILFSFLALSAFAQSDDATLTFTEKSHEFGTIKQGDVVKHTFKYRNNSDAPIKITNVKPSCGCTVPSFSRDEIKPGETGEIFVKFNSAGKMGKQRKSITVMLDKEGARPIILRLNGEVVSPQIDSKQ